MGEASFGKYRLIAELGHGGMADVFLAVQAGPRGSGFHKLSVIKRLRQNLVEEPEFVEMLIEEARIAARLNHPNVVQTNEVGQVGSQYFIAMEYLDGQPLHRIQHRSTQRVKDGKPSPIGQAQQMIIVMDALAGLHHAHDLADYDGSPLQIVHRDVTPQNIFVTYDGQVKVVDFGIAKAAGRASETRQGVVKGKVRYMAPEQAIGHPVDRRADVFSMGIMLWEIATGRRLWKDVDDLEIVRQLLGGGYPASPRMLDPTIPEPLDRICQKALAKDRDDRYESCEAFRVDLEQYLADKGDLIDARRRLAPGVSELFHDKRSEIKAVIEKQLADLAGKPSGEFAAVNFPSDAVSTTTPFTRTISGHPTASVDAVAVLPGEPPPSRRRRFGSVAASIVGMAAVMGAIGFVAWRTTSERQASALQPPVSTEVSVRLRATPETARVSIDDGPLRVAPVELRLPKDNRDHRVRFEADGHVPRTEVVKFGSDLSLSVSLLPMETARPKTASAALGPAPTPPRAAPPPRPGAPVAAANPAPAPVAEEPIAAPPPVEMPAKKPKPKTELDNGDPWANK
jgi:eukaryotic-like serine/threonine-protein kinase